MGRPRLPQPARSLLACIVLFIAYAVAPVNADIATAALVLRWAVTLAMLVALVLVLGRLSLRQLREPDAPLGTLIVGIVAGLLLFALVDYTIAVYQPDEFTSLNTRVDALYFALSTLATVGFGDISAQGQASRIVLCVQMAFNFTAIAGAASLVARKVTARAAKSDRRLGRAK